MYGFSRISLDWETGSLGCSLLGFGHPFPLLNNKLCLNNNKLLETNLTLVPQFLTLDPTATLRVMLVLSLNSN